jgi:hypothetical protein
MAGALYQYGKYSVGPAYGWWVGWIYGTFRLTRWAWPVSSVAAGYLALMMVNVLAPTGLSSPRGALFNLDWITLVVMLAIVIVRGVYFLLARPDRRLGAHTSTTTGADRTPGE